MKEEKVAIQIIGHIETPHLSMENMPIQPIGAQTVEGLVILKPEFEMGLTHLDGFSHMMLIYHFHKINGYELMVTPFMDNTQHGIFATRSPKRPSAIGVSIVQIEKVEGNTVYFYGADMLNNTPLLDIKPFFRQTDNRPQARSGWLDQKENNLASNMRSDNRFN